MEDNRKMMNLVLVPLRDRKPLQFITFEQRGANSRNNEVLPYLKLGFRGNEESGEISKQSQTSKSCKTNFGRVELLLTLWKACGCSEANRKKGSTSNKCTECLNVTQWVKQFMSKELFQAECCQGATKLWVKKDVSYPRSLILVGTENGDGVEYQPIDSILSTAREIDGVTWLGHLDLNEFLFLRFCPPPNQGAVLEFGIQKWTADVWNRSIRDDDIENEKRHINSAIDQKHRLKLPTEETRDSLKSVLTMLSQQVESQGLALTNVDTTKHDVEKADVSTTDHLSTQESNQDRLAWRQSNECSEDILHDAQSCLKIVTSERHLELSCSSQTMKPGTGKPDDEQGKDENCNKAKELPANPAVEQHTAPPFRIYFVREGMDMIDELIEDPDGMGLKHHVIQRNAIVFDHFDKAEPPYPTHFVVSDNGIKPEKLASALGFDHVEDLEDFVDNHGIVCVHRKWAAKGNAFSKPPLRLPELLECYMGLRPKAKRKSPVKEKTRLVKSRNEFESLGKRNQKLSDHFCQLSKLYQTAPIHDTDEWRAYSFNLTAGRLRFLDFDVTDDPEVLQRLGKSKGFGATSMAIVRDFFKTGASNRLRELENDQTRLVMRRMMNIWGVGRAKATELVRAGYQSIQEVKSAVEAGTLLVDRNQYIGLLCYDDIMEEMSRAEVEAIFAIVEKCFKEKYPQVQLQLMGSYRRGKDSCGDVDILAIHPGYANKVPPNAVGIVVDELLARGYIEHHLTYISGMNPDLFNGTIPLEVRSKLTGQRGFSNGKLKAEDTSSTTYFGIIRSPLVSGRRRRLDIKFYPYRERIFASIYFTGNGYFNRAMRLWASRKMSLTLNDHGLFIQHTEVSVLDNPTDEEEVFDKLGLVWKEVTERDSFAAVEGKSGFENATQLRELSRSALRDENMNHKWIS